MKALIFALLLCSTAQAEEFHFKYILGRDMLQYKTEAATWEEAFKRGADFCFKFFVDREKNLTEEKGLDIIDTCANPR
jgi:hypothetical protein